MAGNVEGRTPQPGRPFTQRGFVGVQVDGVGIAGGEQLDLLLDNGHKIVIEDQAAPVQRNNVSYQARGPVALGEFSIDATQLPFDQSVITPDLPQQEGVLVTDVYIYAQTIAGLTSHPSFNLGVVGPAFSDILAGMNLSAGGGIAQGEIRRFSFADGVNIPEVTPLDPLTLRMPTSAVATTYDVIVIVFGRILEP